MVESEERVVEEVGNEEEEEKIEEGGDFVVVRLSVPRFTSVKMVMRSAHHAVSLFLANVLSALSPLVSFAV
ncbi:hypothetical protein J5N97_027872 [Dioscorea zingiberensis]|uniref:Uncharacterized protein n=1 Tax=Dioscorea zingiberensis TaxID=325984 RepID=A0A9D5BY20_9LILI|nr:hypothetical protein J5N97_027872 [Dioscorea zingiberensis]